MSTGLDRFYRIATVGLLLLSLASCKRPTAETVQTPTSIAPLRTNPSAPSSPAEDSIPVTVYKADSQCEKLEPETVQVPRDGAMEAAVARVIEAQRSADFPLSGFRVTRGEDGVVTVDLRLAPDAPRQFVSLSTCEQFALFGSIRETLTRNPDWRVKSVQFTDRGEAIVL